MRFNLFTQVKEKISNALRGNYKRLWLSPALLPSLCMIAFLICLSFFNLFNHKNEDLELAAKLIDALEEKALKGKLNKQKEVDYFRHLSFLEKQTLENPKNTKELTKLKVFSLDPSLKENKFLSDRMEKLTHASIQLKQIDEISTQELRETTFKLEAPLYMDEDDLTSILKQVELNQESGSQRVFKEFSLKKEQLTPHYHTYCIDFTLIERKKA